LKQSPHPSIGDVVSSGNQLIRANQFHKIMEDPKHRALLISRLQHVNRLECLDFYIGVIERNRLTDRKQATKKLARDYVMDSEGHFQMNISAKDRRHILAAVFADDESVMCGADLFNSAANNACLEIINSTECLALMKEIFKDEPV